MSEWKNGKYVRSGVVRWYKDGFLHQDNDLPAVESKTVKKWYQYGQLHRNNDLPAVEFRTGSKSWWFDNKLHRENGPAIEEANGHKKWYLYDVEYTEEEFNLYLEKKKLNKILHIDLKEKDIKSKVKI